MFKGKTSPRKLSRPRRIEASQISTTDKPMSRRPEASAGPDSSAKMYLRRYGLRIGSARLVPLRLSRFEAAALHSVGSARQEEYVNGLFVGMQPASLASIDSLAAKFSSR